MLRCIERSWHQTALIFPLYVSRIHTPVAWCLVGFQGSGSFPGGQPLAGALGCPTIFFPVLSGGAGGGSTRRLEYRQLVSASRPYPPMASIAASVGGLQQNQTVMGGGACAT